MVTGAWGNAGKDGREEGVEKLVNPDGELSKIDDFILPAFPFIFPLFSPLAAPRPLSDSVAEADEAKMGLWQLYFGRSLLARCLPGDHL